MRGSFCVEVCVSPNVTCATCCTYIINIPQIVWICVPITPFECITVGLSSAACVLTAGTIVIVKNRINQIDDNTFARNTRAEVTSLGPQWIGQETTRNKLIFIIVITAWIFQSIGLIDAPRNNTDAYLVGRIVSVRQSSTGENTRPTQNPRDYYRQESTRKERTKVIDFNLSKLTSNIWDTRRRAAEAPAPDVFQIEAICKLRTKLIV